VIKGKTRQDFPPTLDRTCRGQWRLGRLAPAVTGARWSAGPRAAIRSAYGFILRRGATKKRLPGNAIDLDNNMPHGQATDTFRTLIW